LADGCQPVNSPIFRAVVSKLLHQETVSQHHQVHVPCLALAAAQLTVSHTQLLLAVAVKGFRSGPSMSIDLQDAIDFPACAIGNQDLSWHFVAPVLPQDDDPYRVRDVWETHGARVIPLPIVTATKLLAFFSVDRSGEFVGADRSAANLQFAIGLQVSHVGPRLASFVLLTVNMVEIFGTGKIAVEREIARNLPITDPVDQLSKQNAVVFEFFTGCFALFSLFETAELEWIVFAVAAHVVGNQVIMGNLVPLSMVPKPADIVDQFAIMVNMKAAT
jgi:hypothetical protein